MLFYIPCVAKTEGHIGTRFLRSRRCQIDVCVSIRLSIQGVVRHPIYETAIVHSMLLEYENPPSALTLRPEVADLKGSRGYRQLYKSDL